MDHGSNDSYSYNTDLIAIRTRRPCSPSVCETSCSCGIGRRRRRRLLRRCIEQREGNDLCLVAVRVGFGRQKLCLPRG